VLSWQAGDTPGSQWTLVLATAGPDTSAEAPIAQLTVSS
jgi:hypothetical protein